MGNALESVKQGLNEAIGHAKSKQAGVKVHQAAAVDVATASPGRARRFNVEQRVELMRLGLTERQLFWLERELPLIALDITGPSPMRAVQDELKKWKDAFEGIDEELDRATATARNLVCTPGTEAAAHLSMAAFHVDARRALVGIEDFEDATPKRIDVRVLVRLMSAACKSAIENEAPKQRRLRWSKRPAIKRIHDAINRPGDAESTKAAKSLPPSRTAGSPFLRLCEIVFERAVGKTTGSESAIRDYLSQRAGE